MKISIAGCSWKELVILAKKCGFFVRERSNHSVIEDKDGKLITTIPRHAKLNKWTAKGIINNLKTAGCPEKIMKKCVSV